MVSGRSVRDLMATDLVTVSPDDNAADVERQLVAKGIGGAPVMRGGALVGVISRTDLLRNMVVGQSIAELVSDYYRDPGAPAGPLPVLDAEQLQRSRVGDLMPERLFTVTAEDSVSVAARMMLDHRIHRVLVVDGRKLVGVLTSHDLLRLFVE